MVFAGATEAPPVSAPGGPTEVEMVAAMEQHYRTAILAHDALTQGDLVTVRAQLTELAGVELPPRSPDLWVPFHAQLHTAAREGGASTDLATAGAAMASVALACGVCHQAAVDGPVYPVPPATEHSQPLKAQMGAHQWATLMVWNGVTGPSAYAWSLGAEAIAETRIFGEDTSAGANESLAAREAGLRALGKAATTTASLDARAVLYGRMLATCGGCHQAAGVQLPAHGSTPSPPEQ